jgi:hypothetical protein
VSGTAVGAEVIQLPFSEKASFQMLLYRFMKQHT